jgi:hypothetical protein
MAFQPCDTVAGTSAVTRILEPIDAGGGEEVAAAVPV